MLDFFEVNPWTFDVMWSLLLSLILWVLMEIGDRSLTRQIQEPHRLFMAKKLNHYVFGFIYVIGLALIWFQFARNLTTFLGLFTAGLAVALREVFASIAAWIYIMLTKPFSIGDRVLINGQRGDVIDMRLFQFSLVEISDTDQGEQSTGKMIDIPNYFIFLYPITNYVKGFPYIWNEIVMGVTLESNWQEAKTLFEAILIKHTDQFTEEAKINLETGTQSSALFYSVLTPIVYLDIQAGQILLTLRYICPPRQKRTTREQILQDILTQVASHEDIHLTGK